MTVKNRSVFSAAPPEIEPLVPGKPPKTKVPKKTVHMTQQQVFEDLQQSPKLVRKFLSRYYAGVIKGVNATEIIAASEAAIKAKSELRSKAQWHVKNRAIVALAVHVEQLMQSAS
jgi:hypothetical protein